MFFRSYSKPGKGVNKEDLDKSGVELYFDILGRRIWKLMSLNLFYLAASIPAILISVVISIYFFSLVAAIKNIPVQENATSIVISSILLGFMLFQLTGSGPASVAKNYVLRKYVNDEHSWVVSDFIDNIKRNFKQGIAVYLTNIIALSVLLLSWVFYSFVHKNVILSTGAIIIAAIFSVMQLYVYQLVASMTLKVKHIYKNALVLTLIKLPWNILVVAVTLIFVYIVYYFALKLPAACIFFILAIYFTIVRFTQIFMTNNIMKKYVIEPGLSEGQLVEKGHDE